MAEHPAGGVHGPRPPTHILDPIAELARVGAALAASGNIPSIAAGLADYAMRLGADACWVGLADGGGDRVRPVAHRGHDACILATAACTRAPDGTLAEPLRRALATGRTVVVDLGGAGDARDRLLADARTRGHRALAAVPLASAGRPIGAVCAYGSAAGLFEEMTGHLLGLASQIAAGAVAAAQALERAGRSEGQFHDLLDHLPCVAYSVRAGEPGEIIFISGNVEELLGYPPDAFYADNTLWSRCIHPDDLERVATTGLASLTRGQSFVTGHRIVHRSGQPTYYVTTRVKPWRDATGRIALYQGITVEATEQKRLEQELLQAQRLAAVGEMAAMMAHEIRNPVAGMSLALRMLRGAQGDRALEDECIDDLADCLRRINATVSRVLDFSKAKPLAARPCRLADVVESATRLTASYVRKSGATIEADLAPDLPDLVGDPDQLEQVFVNLILNACQAMPDGGGVAIRAHAAAGRLHAEVADTGIGIAPDELEHIFGPFYSGFGSGTGLGLPLCRRIVTAHGGTIAVESQPGRGSTFRVDLPLEPAHGAHPGD